MSGVNCLAPPKGAAHQSRCSGHQVFAGQYMGRTGLVVQRRRARHGIPGRSKKVHTYCRRFVNQLQKSFTFSRIRVDMMQKKGRRDRFGNRAESTNDEVDIVHVLPFERPTFRAELSSNRQPARQPASNAVGQDGFHSFGRSMRIALVPPGPRTCLLVSPNSRARRIGHAGR
jgi:hypothetical protein